MKLQKLYRRIERIMAAVAFAEAGEFEEAVTFAYPPADKGLRKEKRNRAEQDNRPVLHC